MTSFGAACLSFTWPLVLQQASPGLLLWQWQVPSGEAKAQNWHDVISAILLAKASLQLNLDQGEGEQGT